MTAPDSLVEQINLALDASGETLHGARGREIGDLGRWYVADHLGCIVQRHVCVASLAVELGVLSRKRGGAVSP